MSDVIIENPVINSPFKEPQRHFRFAEAGITNEIVERRRVSAYFIPIAQPRKKGKQLGFETEWTKDRIKENDEINRIRSRVALWRDRDYPDISKLTRRLLQYWTNPDRDNKLFFCQIEAVETAIYLAEAAGKGGDGWVANLLREASDEANPGLFRIAFKMATGAGKTVVMAMLISWQALNKLANPQSPLFSDAFLVVTPGITIRDRLRVLLPNDPQNYYRERDILPPDLLEELGKAKILITNFHAFLLREKGSIPSFNKAMLLRRGRPSPFTESPDEMVRRVCRELGPKKNIVVIDDDAHHCYRRKVEADDEKLTGDERREAQKRDEEARVWVTGLQAVQAKLGIRAVYTTVSRPFDPPKTGKIAVKVINHYGDEVMKVFRVE
jgi:type III restriction enzyme